MARVVRVISRQNLKRVLAGELHAPAVVVDVREPDEVAQGMIPSAVSVPLATVPDVLRMAPEQLAAVLHRDPADFDPDDTTFVFYCRSGARSGMAANAALQLDYDNVFNYEGSWLDWSASDEEVAYPEA